MIAAGLRLYGNAATPSCRRVLIYLAEKDLEVDLVVIDLAAGEQRTVAFLAMNPAGKVPVLETADGRFIAEAAAIVEYVEELYPAPSLLGATPEERALVRTIERMASELSVLVSLMARHGDPAFADRIEQDPALARGLRPIVRSQLDMLERRIAAPFVAGDRPSIADCTLFPVVAACRAGSLPLAADHPRLDAWHDRFSRRPSTSLQIG